MLIGSLRVVRKYEKRSIWSELSGKPRRVGQALGAARPKARRPGRWGVRCRVG